MLSAFLEDELCCRIQMDREATKLILQVVSEAAGPPYVQCNKTTGHVLNLVLQTISLQISANIANIFLHKQDHVTSQKW